MIQCWQDENSATNKWNVSSYKNATALQQDTVPYLRIRHFDEGFGNWHDTRVEPFGWYVNLNGSGLESAAHGRPKLDEWWEAAGQGSYHTSWLYHIQEWRNIFLTHKPDSAFLWHSHSWRVQLCSQQKLVQMTSQSPDYNKLNEDHAGGWANATLSWAGNTGYPSRRFSTWLESPHYQGCYLYPGSVPIHRKPGVHDRLDGYPYSVVAPGFLPPGEQDASLAGILDGYRVTYTDEASMPCTFPSLPVARMIDELIFLTEISELSFTDIAFVDFEDTRNKWPNNLTSSKEYRHLLGRQPQSLNDFSLSCTRLQSADRLYNMTLNECELKRLEFSNSIKTIRMNTTASQTPYLSGAILNGDRGNLDATSTSRGVYGFYNIWPSAVQGSLPREWGNALHNIEVIDFGIADKMLGYTNRIVGETLQGTIPSTWANMTKLWYLNLHQQLGMCAWGDDNTPFNIHMMAGRSNVDWYLNVTANQDWTTQHSALMRDDLRNTWGAKVPVWHGWKPLDGPYLVRDNTLNNDNRTVLQVFTPYNMTRLPFECLKQSTNDLWHFTRLPEEMMMWPLQEDDTCLKYMNTDASMWGLDSCWTQWPRDDSWENPYLHFSWSDNTNYTYADERLTVRTLAKVTNSYYEPFVQRTFRNMTYYGYNLPNRTKDWWRVKNFADWTSTPWGPTAFTTSYKRQPDWDWAWRYSGSFWYSNFHFPMVTEMVHNNDLSQGTIRGRHQWGNNQCVGSCGGLIYNNHIFLDWQDRRMGDNSTNFAAMSYMSAYPNGSIQSLPSLLNPCDSIWSRYFENDTNHQTWFTNSHFVEREQMMDDCNQSVTRWQLGIKQIRLIRNVTKPLASHNIQALRPSNLDSMTDAFHLDDRWLSLNYPGTLQAPIHYDGPTPNQTYWYNDMGPHAYHNPPSGSILTKATSWPSSIASALGFDPLPNYTLADEHWWQDMLWYTNHTLNMTIAPKNKLTISQRYWEWDARYPSTYPAYYAPWPNETWNGAAWPAHLYGSLPASWGDIQNDTQMALLPNIRIMYVAYDSCSLVIALTTGYTVTCTTCYELASSQALCPSLGSTTCMNYL